MVGQIRSQAIVVDDEEFLRRIQQKIAHLTCGQVELVLDLSSERSVTVEMDVPAPKVVMHPRVLKYPGLVRMSIEYAVACIRQGRVMDLLEFQVLLSRN